MKLQQLFRAIPSVDELLKKAAIQPLIQQYSRNLIVCAIREALADIRLDIQKGLKKGMCDPISGQAVEKKITHTINRYANCGIKKVVNATGIILSTNLGRAVLPRQALDALSKMNGYVSLEVDLETGDRGKRWNQIEKLLQVLTNAQACALTNNNAAATLLILNTLAQGQEVIVSRGQLIEIGGSFRLPDVMLQSGCILKEIGTTNRTHAKDYIKAITKNTGLIFHTHTSNYTIKGFTATVPITELVAIGKKYKIPVVDDLGSGALIDLSAYGFIKEPTVQESIKSGADIVCFSGDKLLGSCQGGFILGKKKYIELIRKNPLMRALRLGKLSLACLEATLRLYLEPENISTIPVLTLLKATSEELRVKACQLAEKIKVSTPQLMVEVKDDFSKVGGGSLAEENIPTIVLSLKHKDISSQELARRLRFYTIPILTRIKAGAVLLDMRTVLPGEEKIISDAFTHI